MQHKGSGFYDKRVSIRFTVGGLFIIATLLTAIIAIGFQFYFSKQIATENALTTYSAMSKTVSRYIRNIDEDAASTTRLFAQIGSTGKLSGAENEDSVLTILAEAMKSNPHFYSLYIASNEEQFFQLINLESSSIVRKKIKANKEDRWVLIKIFNRGGERIKQSHYYMDGFKLRYTKEEISNYFPTQRPWYASAGRKDPFKSSPYLFQHLKITGQTYSMHIPNTNKVLGVDIVLSSISYAMLNSSLGKASETQQEAFIYKKSGEIIASNQGNRLTQRNNEIEKLDLSDQEQQLVNNTRSLKVSNQLAWGPIDYAISGKPQGYAIDLLNIIEQKTGLKFEYINGFSWAQLVSKYNQGELDVLHSLLKTEEREREHSVSLPLYQLPFSVVTQKNHPTITDLKQLKEKKVAILDGWSIIPELRRNYPKMQITTYNTVKEVLNAVDVGLVSAAIESDLIVKHTMSQYFIEGLKVNKDVQGFDGNEAPFFHLMMKKQDKAIVDLINRAIEQISDEQKQALNEKWYDINGTQLVNDTVIPYLALFELAHAENLQNQLIQRDIKGVKTYFFVTRLNENEYFSVVLPSKLIFAQVSEKIFLSIVITMTLMGLLLPLAWGFGSPIVRPIRLLEKETLKIQNRDYDSVKQIDTRIKEVWELSSSIVSMSQDLKQHEQAQEEFVEAFIQLIAQAIDDKSPYTAGHCNRVPELAMMLADAAHESNLQGVKTFSFLNDDERREFRIAAWLHDCGKITTPEHIVDKGSKLETNYNRIHEVRMRFEVLWRDAQIEYLKQRNMNPKLATELEKEWRLKQEQLQADFAFIAAANVGQEFMSDEHIERVKQIAEMTWDRHFDDRLGLSPIEELAITKSASSLPVKEPLLSDKPEHIIARSRRFDIDPKFGIKMDVPEHQYNLGEIYNLTIKRGTLTAEDRFKINEHMISTIKMLESLPFPSELARVPRYASTHHETLKGTGYPRKLSAEDLSIPERILVLSDIFEALTAADRPYKKEKSISAALTIMTFMVKDEHIDKDIFNLFLQSKTYLRYAEHYLKPSQIDHVDIDEFLIK